MRDPTECSNITIEAINSWLIPIRLYETKSIIPQKMRLLIHWDGSFWTFKTLAQPNNGKLIMLIR
jgi:hypothetical protein